MLFHFSYLISCTGSSLCRLELPPDTFYVPDFVYHTWQFSSSYITESCLDKSEKELVPKQILLGAEVKCQHLHPKTNMEVTSLTNKNDVPTCIDE